MTTSFVSTSYLGTALLPTIAPDAIAARQPRGRSRRTGQYADIGLQLGDQSGYELSLKNQNDLLQTLTTQQRHRHDEPDDRAGRAQFDSSPTRKTRRASLTHVDARRRPLRRPTLAEPRRQRAAIADRHDQHDVERPICLRRRSTPASRRWPTISPRRRRPPRPRSTRRFRRRSAAAPTDAAAATITASAHADFPQRPVRRAVQRRRIGRPTGRRPRAPTPDGQIAPGETIDTSTNANQPGFQQLAEGYAMLSRIRRLVSSVRPRSRRWLPPRRR